MDILRTIQTVANGPRTALTQRPLGEFAVLGALMLALQHGYTGVSGNTPAAGPLAADAPFTLQQDAAQTVAAISAGASSDTTQTSEVVARNIDSLVDTINNPTAWVHRILNEAPVLSSAKPNTSETSLRFNTNLAEPNSAYLFASKLKKPLFKAINTNPFAIERVESEALSIWQINQEFALARNYSESPKRKWPARTDGKFVIMLDPGHGGSDPGSIGHNGLKEKLLTLDIAKRAERILEKQSNITVLLTRDSDTGMSRKSRVQRVKDSQADMVVSLHLNHLPQTDVNLVETFYAAPHNIHESIEKQRANQNGFVKAAAGHNVDLSFTQGSKQLASLMQKNVYQAVIENNPDTDNAGVKQDTLYILTRSFTPGVLIELSCLSNVQEAERLNEPAYRQTLAEALARGIGEYLKTPAAKQQFGPEV